MSMLLFSRQLAGVMAILIAFIALGGLLLGVQLQDGRYLALASLSAGLTLAFGLWWRLAAHAPLLRLMKGTFLAMFCATAGLALYSNLVYLMWIAGYPMAIGTVAAGKMGENYWLPPVTLLYAVFLFGILKQSANRRK